MEDEKKWYVLWTTTYRPLNIINQIVTRSGALLWTPSYTELNALNKVITIPIYDDYYFVNGTVEQIEAIIRYIALNRYKGVLFLKGDNGNPIALSEEEVASMKEIEATFDVNYRQQVLPTIAIGSKVIISEGVLSYAEAEVLEIKKSLAKVKLNMFNREIMLWVPIQKCKLQNTSI